MGWQVAGVCVGVNSVSAWALRSQLCSGGDVWRRSPEWPGNGSVCVHPWTKRSWLWTQWVFSAVNLFLCCVNSSLKSALPFSAFHQSRTLSLLWWIICRQFLCPSCFSFCTKIKGRNGTTVIWTTAWVILPSKNSFFLSSCVLLFPVL